MTGEQQSLVKEAKLLHIRTTGVWFAKPRAAAWIHANTI